MQQSTKYSDATYFHNHGMLVFIDSAHKIAHNKLMIIDDHVIITGSFNFSNAAEQDNAENVLIIEHKPLLSRAYLTQFSSHLDHVSVYKPPQRISDSAEPSD